jgi:hypothetical protein
MVADELADTLLNGAFQQISPPDSPDHLLLFKDWGLAGLSSHD